MFLKGVVASFKVCSFLGNFFYLTSSKKFYFVRSYKYLNIYIYIMILFKFFYKNKIIKYILFFI